MKSKDRIMRLAMSITSVFVLTMVLALLAPLPLGTRTAAGYEPARAQMIGPSDRGPIALLPDTTFKLYLPLLLKSSGGVAPPPGATSTPVPHPGATSTPVPQPGGTAGLFPNKTNSTDSPKVMIDGLGGLHMAYSAYGADSTGKMPAYYAHCAANCGSSSSWGFASFGDQVNQVEFALTKAGHPRLLLYTSISKVYEYDASYWYAACDTGCTSSTGWKVTLAATTSYTPILDPFNLPLHSFALDNLDRPRFVYQKYQAGGAVYAYCDAADCTNPGTWSEAEIASYYPDTYTLLNPSLTFTSDGKARMAVAMTWPNHPSYALAYWTCDSACDQAASWQFYPLFDGNGAEFVLRLDSQNRPRMAVYQGAPASGTPGMLYYVACDANCTDSANWNSSDINLPANLARGPDLALDSQGRPRIAYHDDVNSVVGYAWCNVNCSTESAGWQHTTPEANSALALDFSPPIPISCSLGYWFSGNRPSLALSSAGNPRIGHEAAFWSGGTCITDKPTFRAVRLTYFNQP